MLVRAVTVVFFALSGLVSTQLFAAGSNIPVPEDLQALGKQSRAANVPVMVMFAASDCGFCDRLEAEHLVPMVTSGSYENKVIIRKVIIDNYAPIKNFDGQAASGEALADLYGIRVTPTVMLFADNGRRVSKKLIGYNGNDYYGWDLDKLIESANKELGKAL